MTVKWLIDSYLWAGFNPMEEGVKKKNKKKKITCQLNREWVMAVSFEVPLMHVSYSEFRALTPLCASVHDI